MTFTNAQILFDAMDEPHRARVRNVFNATFWDPACLSVYDAFMQAVAEEAAEIEQRRLAEETTEGAA